jgi:UDP-N-acetylmuramate dehydrogenase
VRENGEPEIHERVDLRAWTALGVGGLSDLLIRCRSADGLQRALDVLATHGHGWFVLGGGSRLIPSDRGLRVAVLNLSGNLGLWELDLDGAVSGAGANLAQVCRAAVRTGMSGNEDMMRTRSTVGGAVEAAIHGQRRFLEVLDWIDLASPGGPIERLSISDRRDRGTEVVVDLDRRVVVRARLQLASPNGPSKLSRAVVRAKERGHRQPRSVEPLFYDTPDARAEPLLADTDCAELKVGGARMSRRHPNRLCTSKTTRAADVLELTRLAKDRVLQRTGIDLHPAVCFVDEDGGEIDL